MIKTQRWRQFNWNLKNVFSWENILVHKLMKFLSYDYVIKEIAKRKMFDDRS